LHSKGCDIVLKKNFNSTHGIEQIKIKIESIQIHSNTLIRIRIELKKMGWKLMDNLLVNIVLEFLLERHLSMSLCLGFEVGIW
jgi:hypothetical protein